MIKAFYYGMKEFRLSVTSTFEYHQSAYDRGREFMHIITFRYFE
jgi:hypothetical protein